ncbi:DUF3592 domain-containing protein [Neorhodopirellula pilleata]|uniref:DUF3592 domain-containing protein n=1 Tax=Neorhodopirellula pilleata TaxID=2714738 RepID=A0A5C6A3A0_9BACT|nr:DUF3592 domain-containing protein [Neorhodopirellula pilleata]TWT94382.1 hypothetical protein Pla100_39940 [Neorhodopirellula pilleata]
MIRVLIPLLAGCSLLVSLIATVLTADFLRDAKRTTGTVVDLHTTTNDDGDLLFKPTFTFAANGRDYSVEAYGHVSPSPGDVGDRIDVLYDPTSPSNARIDTFAYTWLIPFVTFVLGCVLGAIHFALAWCARNFRYVGQDGGEP